MSKETYTIPVAPNACKDFDSNAIDLCNANAAAWGIPDAKLTAINLKRTDSETKSAIVNNRTTQSRAATGARDGSWDLLKAEVIDLYDHYILNNNAISVADKEALYIHYLVGGGGTSTPAPSTTPVVSLVSEAISTLFVVFTDSATPGSHAKPDNVAFCVIKYKVDVPLPAGPEECPEDVNISRSHTAIVFTPAQRGKVVNGYARWVNNNGKTGPWSGLITAIVP